VRKVLPVRTAPSVRKALRVRSARKGVAQAIAGAKA